MNGGDYMKLEKGPMRQFYKDEIIYNFWPFWQKAVDTEYGGVFTCFSNEGSELVSTDKYTWSQGRFLWLCSELYEFAPKNDMEIDANQLKLFAQQTYGFLIKHTLLPNQHVLYAVRQNGERIEAQQDISVFADAFFILGVNKYALIFQDVDAFDQALAVYRSIMERVSGGSFKTEPYPIPEGFTSHSINMILMNVAQELAETAIAFANPISYELAEDCRKFSAFILDNLIEDDGRIVELLPENRNNINSLIARHVNPGHTLESIWFQIHNLPYLDGSDEATLFDQWSKAALFALEVGWDHDYGGLLRFVDKTGGVPKGCLMESPYEHLIIDTWDTKLWWPHSEALYTTLLLYEKTNHPVFMKWYEKLSRYIFETFPNPNNEVREWIQIRERQGKPLNKVVALPVKDPFHIIRNFILILKLLR